MKTQSYGIRLDPALKQEGTEILESVGLNFADGVKLFLKQMVNRGEFPLELKTPNAETRAAIDELESSGFSDSYNSLEELSEKFENENS